MKPIEEMTGLELNTAIMVEVMGCERCRSMMQSKTDPEPRGWKETATNKPRDMLDFAGDISAAFALVGKMREKGFVFFYLSTVPCDEVTRSKASFSRATPLGRKSFINHDAIVDTAPRAICIAALKAVRAK